MPDVTIIIPVFNRQALGERALRSALAQKAADAEVVIIDDCSDPAFVLPAGLSAANVRVIRHPVNRGAAAARNTAIDTAQGEWLAFLDSDDYWLPDTLAPRLALAKTAGVPLVAYAAGFTLADERSGRCDTRIPRGSDNPLDFASGCWFSPGSTLLLRREAFSTIGPYDTGLSRLEDLDWFLRFALAGGRLDRWPHVAAMIELGGKPRRDALEQSARHLLAKYAEPGATHRLAPAFVRRLKAYLDVERASIAAADRAWPSMLFYLARSFMRVPRLTLHLERFWD